MSIHLPLRSPALLLAASIWLTCSILVADEAVTPTTNVPELFATGLVDHSAIRCDGEGNVLATNYRHAGTVGQINAETGASILFEVPAAMGQDTKLPLVGLALDGDGRVLTLDSQQGKIFRWNPETMMVSVVVDRIQGRRFDSLFAIAVGPGGNIYFSEPDSSSLETPNGAVYRFDVATNRPTLVADGLDQPTGICLSSNGKFLFVAEAGRSRINVFALKEDGVVEKARTYFLDSMLDLDNGTEIGRLGHMTIDRRGWLYVTLWDQGNIAVIDTNSGKLLETIGCCSDRVFGVTLWQDALLMSIPSKEAIFRLDLRPLISRHAP
ncbi:SMP-30/gluconolactonase/LRE family protein [Bremerella cremea]|uniref:SMP-30/Gluconolactonase/LRE-like region domain-containing protein n=1 Tax=Blastopirellula marina TaxID=124 RepID=A0A2S8FPP7_9BACT|nr:MULTISPECIES: SMP-30/gluconolactonase/LRE family protein [Pirellulaceae]PQO34163.1 hypothetical protein C5Y83_11520 [Blastopirellula marina]RCS46659.1 SMP-30/gluconolactonase/LRE family protein [Bremerella cremea]